MLNPPLRCSRVTVLTLTEELWDVTADRWFEPQVMEKTETFSDIYLVSHHTGIVLLVSWMYVCGTPTDFTNYGLFNWSWATWSCLRFDNRPTLEQAKSLWTVVQLVHFLLRELVSKAEIQSQDLFERKRTWTERFHATLPEIPRAMF